jgi:transposase InsO family protein
MVCSAHSISFAERPLQFIEFCPCCQKMSRIAPAIQATPFTMVTYRFGERVDIDTIGPLPKDDYDNEYVVVIVDAFSRFVKLTPVKSTSGFDAARALIDFVGTFAYPRIIHSDRGTQFLNDMITSLVTEASRHFNASRRPLRRRKMRSLNAQIS